MKREERLTKPQEFSQVYTKGLSKASRLLVLRALPNNLPHSRFGFSVSKRVGNAVTRNHIKRLLREIAPRIPIKSPNDIVFIVRPAAADSDFHMLSKEVEQLLSRAGLLLNDEPGSARKRDSLITGGPEQKNGNR